MKSDGRKRDVGMIPVTGFEYWIASRSASTTNLIAGFLYDGVFGSLGVNFATSSASMEPQKNAAKCVGKFGSSKNCTSSGGSDSIRTGCDGKLMFHFSNRAPRQHGVRVGHANALPYRHGANSGLRFGSALTPKRHVVVTPRTLRGGGSWASQN